MTEDCDWLNVPAAPLDAGAAARARARQERLTKPPGSLGRLETLAERLAALQGRECPRPPQPWITVFAGDHGVVAEGISRFPQAVTGQMVANFATGGAAITVLARSLEAGLEIIDLGTLPGGPEPEGVIRAGLGPGTANFAREPAMTPAQLERALNTGRQAAERARQGGAGLFIGGEMGIGNTTAAAAVACGLLGASPDALAGPGTGLDPAGVRHKAEVIERALALHAEAGDSALEWLRRVGGFEIAGLTGAFLASAQIGQPVLVDGFIASTAALVATRLCPGAGDWFFYAHRSAEPGHDRVLEALGAQPVLDLGMRLGEGSGAATAVPLLRMACELHAGMATFDEAGVADDESGAGA